jgi:hypothetical protein
MELNFGYVASYIICRLWEKKFHKVTEHIFLYDLFCLYAISALMIFVAKCK